MTNKTEKEDKTIEEMEVLVNNTDLSNKEEFRKNLQIFALTIQRQAEKRGVELGRILEACNCKDSIIDCHPEYSDKANDYFTSIEKEI